MTAPTRKHLETELRLHGLRLRGGWIPSPADTLPPLPDGQSAAVVWMVGMAGSECWPAFSASPMFSDGLTHPMDRWAANIGNSLAKRWNGVALYPSDGPPYFPFQQWADRSEPTQSSPMMLHIHPEYGLWHAYRFALALPILQAGDLDRQASAAPRLNAALCLQCDGQPCLQACPVNAYNGQSFAVHLCRSHLRSPQGQECMENECLARRACPVGQDYAYQPEHAAFHMRAFLHSTTGDQN
jgi:hypothetical protein